ncbi:hypothetical protein [Streptomyces sp. NPDC048172]|uniref:hypothetical protein n=1 Tax=Streptomyces sp. NPDC048172 TaxID=3365505 RepID=UPI003715F0E0
MPVIRKVTVGIAAGLAAIASALVPMSSAGAATTDTTNSKCAVKSPWGVKGYKLCNSDPYKHGYVDWDSNGTTDEVFVIAPDYTIWHTWKAAGRWVEMPGKGRADGIEGHNGSNTTRERCIVVTVSWKDYPYYQNCFYSGKWHSWRTAG